MIKRSLTLWMTAATLGVSHVLAQQPPAPPPVAPAAPVAPVAPVPPAPPTPPRSHHLHPGEPVTYLGVGVEPIPDWLGDQLNLPAGFGLVVNYVAKGGPAELAGLKEHDILKQVNDQMLTNPDQLTSLVRSMPDGQEISLTVVRKGQDAKLTAKLQKHSFAEDEDRSKRRGHPYRFDYAGGYGEKDEDNDDDDAPGVPPVADIMSEIGPAVREIKKKTIKGVTDALKAQKIIIMRDEDGKSSMTKVGLGKGTIVVRDDRGTLVITGHGDGANLVAKDKQGTVVYNGPAKDAPPDLLSRTAKFEKNGNVIITGDKVMSYEMKDTDDADDDDAPAKASPSPSPSPAKQP